MTNKEFFDPYILQKFDNEHCFLCGSALKPADTSTREHIFPRWLQNKYNLWDQLLRLPNGTHIAYRQLTIPCCAICNREHLSKLEKEIQRAVENGYKAFSALNKVRIFQWQAKLLYGILFKELSLLVDRSNTQEGTMTTPKLLEEMNTLHGFLQSIRYPIKFEANNPWSIFVFECHDYNDFTDFHYDNLSMILMSSMRLGKIGIIASLEDNGILNEWFEQSFNRFEGIRLHPIQFDELAAIVAYRLMLLNRSTKSITIMSDEGEVLVVSPSLRGYNDATVFGQENVELKKECFIVIGKNMILG